MSRRSPICFYDPPSILLDCGALTFQTWMLGGHPGLVAHGNPSKGLGALQLSKGHQRGERTSIVVKQTFTRKN